MYASITFTDHGHNSAEDAEVCIQLIKAFLKNRIN